MARLFDDASSEYLEIDQTVLSAPPFAMACFYNTNDMSVSSNLISLADKDDNATYSTMFVSGPLSKLYAQTKGGGSSGFAISGAAVLVDTWQHAAGIYATTTDRRVLINGGSKGTNATSVTATGFDRTSIGRLGDVTPGVYASGLIAEVAIWDLSVWPGATDSEKADNFEKIVLSLTDGFSPLFFPLGLRAYWPLVRGLNDRIGGFNMTATGTVVSAHPRIIYPSKIWVPSGAAAPPVGNPWNYYAQQCA